MSDPIKLSRHSDGIGFTRATLVLDALSELVRPSDPALADYLRDVKERVPEEHVLQFSLEGVESKSPYETGAPLPSDVQGSATNLFNELAKIVSKAGRVLDIELESAERERRASEAHAERVRQQAGG